VGRTQDQDWVGRTQNQDWVGWID